MKKPNQHIVDPYFDEEVFKYRLSGLYISEEQIMTYEEFVQERFDIIRNSIGLHLAVYEKSEFIKVLKNEFSKVIYSKNMSRVVRDYLFDESYTYLGSSFVGHIEEIWYPAPHLAWFKYPM